MGEAPLGATVRRDRFLTPALGVWLAGYVVFAVSFSAFQIKGDPSSYFNLLRRFFGEHPDFAFAYQFGIDYWNWPFFLIGKGLESSFGQPRTFHVTFEEISITLAANVAFLVILRLAWTLLRDLGLPRGPAVLFTTTFGSPLFYYVVFEPGSKHAVDTLVVVAAMVVTLRLIGGASDRVALALGVLAAVSIDIRWVNVALFAPIAVSLWLVRRRAAAIGAATTVVLAPALYGVPALRGISYFVPSYFPKDGQMSAGVHPMIGGVSSPLNGFDPLIPLKMLFSIHRGLFVWTPLTALAVVGFALALQRERDPVRRRFMFTLLAASVCLLLFHMIWGQWDGGFAFSERFLTSLFPLYLIGIAELVRRIGSWVYVPVALCIMWSLVLAFVHVIGYDGISQADGADREMSVVWHNFAHMRHEWDKKWEDRWSYLWYLPQGVDPQHVHAKRHLANESQSARQPPVEPL